MWVGKNDRVRFAQAANQVADLNDLLGVKTYRGFIKNDDLGIADQRLRNAYSLAVALGKRANDLVVHIADLYRFADLFDVLTALQLTTLEVVCKVEVFPNGHIQIEGGLLGEISDQLFCTNGVAENINARNASLAGGGRKISGENIHRGALARTVGAQEANDLAFFNRKANVVHSTGGAVIFYKMLNFYHERVRSFLTHSGEKTLPHL